MESVAKDWTLGALQDQAIDKWNGFAEKKLATKDPYRYETPEGKTKKLKLDECASKEDQKMWKWVQKRAWLDDKCFMGCYPIDCGIGLGPIAVMIPVIGPFLMYGVHAKLTTRAGQYWHLDAATVAKMQANILFDFLISLPPFIGSLFVWMNGCSTRNAAIIHTEVSKQLLKQQHDVEMQNKQSSRGRDEHINQHGNQSRKQPLQQPRKQPPQQQQKQPQQQPQVQKQNSDYHQPLPPKPVQTSNSYNVPPVNYQPKYQNPFNHQGPADGSFHTSPDSRGPAIPQIPFDDPPVVPPRK